MNKYIAGFILAAIVGVIGGLQGNAGSVYILTGLLALNLVENQKMAAGTTLLYTSIPLTMGAAYEYYKKGNVDVKLAGVLIVSGFMFSILGAKLNYLISKKNTLYSTAIMMFCSSLFFFRRAYLTNN